MGLLKEIKRRLSHFTFKGSTQYWVDRYANGGNSGAGSNGRLQDYKAKFINEFIQHQGITSVLDMGVGDGSFAKMVMVDKYHGYDISNDVIRKCNDMSTMGIINNRYTFGVSPIFANLVLSLDVIYHLTEDEVYYDYLQDLFQYSTKYVIIYGYEHNDGKTWAHVKPRFFTLDIQKAFPEWELVAMHHPPYTWDENDKANTTKSRFYIYKKKME